MQSHEPREISDGVHWVGARDWNRRLFDALIPLPQGTTYNAYVVKGASKTALVDTVNPGFEEELQARVERIAELASLDYVVMNHAEPDHAGSIPYVLERNESAVLVTTKKGAEMASAQYGVREARIHVVKDGDTIPLGGKTLRFIDAPWLHWPETMFTYLEENQILFPCDFLGMHTAHGFYDDDVEELIPFAKRYFGEIMMPFRSMGMKALGKIGDLDIKIIAPSHGPIHRNPDRILDAYRHWLSGETEEKVLVVYVSMWNSTEAMVNTMVETLFSEGIDVKLFRLPDSDVGDIARELVDSRGIVLGTPTVLGGMHPAALYAASLVRLLRPPLKCGVVLSSHGWSGGAVKQAAEVLSPTKIEVLGAIDIRGPPSEDDMKRIVELGKELSIYVKKDAE